MVHPRLNVSTAFGKALTTWSSWVDKHINSKKTQVFFRTSAPSHFRFGSDIHSAIVFPLITLLSSRIANHRKQWFVQTLLRYSALASAAIRQHFIVNRALQNNADLFKFGHAKTLQTSLVDQLLTLIHRSTGKVIGIQEDIVERQLILLMKP